MALVAGFASLVWRAWHKDVALRGKIASLNERIAEAEEQNRKLSQLVEYFSTQENLEKEARARFNLKKPNEEVLIIPPEPLLPSPAPTPTVTAKSKTALSFSSILAALKNLIGVDRK